MVIVGPTASGKTSLAIDLAKKYGGEIICADSRTIYRGLDIGTAKPMSVEQDGIPHWGLDLVEPGQRFTAADFKDYAVEKIAEIRHRGYVPFLVGGTGLYINSVVYDYIFPPEVNTLERNKYNNMSFDMLYKYCAENNIKLPENDKNKRYVINAILRKGREALRRSEPLENTYIVGIASEKSELSERIERRAREIWANGVIDEAKKAARKHGWDNAAMTGNIYPIIRDVLDGRTSRIEAIERFAVLDRRLAKRQLTWFKRDSNIVWLPRDEAYTYCAHILDRLNKL